MKAGALRAIDSAALSRPWSWCDGTFLWNEEADHGVLAHGGTRWPISPENRAAIESAMNHMPALVSLVDALERRQTATCTRPGLAGCSHGYHVIGCDVEAADDLVVSALADVHAVPPPAPASPVAWDPDRGSPAIEGVSDGAATPGVVNLDGLESLARSSTPDQWADEPINTPATTLALIATIRELRAGLACALSWLQPGVHDALEMARDREELSKLLDKEIKVP